MLGCTASFLVQTTTLAISNIIGNKNLPAFLNFPILAYLAFYAHSNCEARREKAPREKQSGVDPNIHRGRSHKDLKRS